MVGNKVDLGDSSRLVSNEEIKQWCSYHANLPYFETSAKTDINITEVFREAVQLWIKREAALDAAMRSTGQTFNLNEHQENKRTRRSCC